MEDKAKVQYAISGLSIHQKEALLVALFGKSEMTDEGWSLALKAIEVLNHAGVPGEGFGSYEHWDFRG